MIKDERAVESEKEAIESAIIYLLRARPEHSLQYHVDSGVAMRLMDTLGQRAKLAEAAVCMLIDVCLLSRSSPSSTLAQPRTTYASTKQPMPSSNVHAVHYRARKEFPAARGGSVYVFRGTFLPTFIPRSSLPMALQRKSPVRPAFG